MGKKYFIIICFGWLLVSCNTNKIITNGHFSQISKLKIEIEGTDIIKTDIILNSDSTFIFKEFAATCQGKWQYISNNTILLECFKEKGYLVELSYGYVTIRERKIRVINKNKIKMYNSGNKPITLKRIE